MSGINSTVRPPLPCPFCGAAPVVSYGKVRCTNPACVVQPKSRVWWDKDFMQQAVDEWNRRPNDNNEGQTSKR